MLLHYTASTIQTLQVAKPTPWPGLHLGVKPKPCKAKDTQRLVRANWGEP